MKSRFILLIGGLLLLSACNDPNGPDHHTTPFGIYLLADTTLTTADVKIFAIDELEVQEKPLISISSIQYYNWSEHIITLTYAGAENYNRRNINVTSVCGWPFIVMVENEKIYLGNFYPPFSSIKYPDLPEIMLMNADTLQIRRASSQETKDKRTDRRIYSVLKRENKLVF
ncbi:hypothetical protein KC799_14715 [candidate division KSB1 bacterium]|nr:hypothetical protein [candidate division KSB1 bacterium]